MSTTSGSAALSTAAPDLRTEWTIAPFTQASFSGVSISAMPRWSPEPMFVTTPTSQASKPQPSRRMPPRAVSKTAVVTEGLASTRRALCGPLQSPLSIFRPPTQIPSVQVVPTVAPPTVAMWERRRTTVVLPLVPVTAATGIRPSSPGAKSVSMIAAPTLRGLPTAGSRCIRRPGPALTSMNTPPCNSSGREMSVAMQSMPAISRPMILAASIARAAISGWTMSVTSSAVPPVERLALRRSTTV